MFVCVYIFICVCMCVFVCMYVHKHLLCVCAFVCIECVFVFFDLYRYKCPHTCIMMDVNVKLHI